MITFTTRKPYGIISECSTGIVAIFGTGGGSTSSRPAVDREDAIKYIRARASDYGFNPADVLIVNADSPIIG